MNDINKMPPKCQYCPYWEVCKYPWVCPDIGDKKPDLQPTCNQLATDCISRHGVSAWLENMGYSKLADAVMDKDRFPSVQPERKRGKWILQDDKDKKLFGWYCCSECGFVIGRHINFCSNCGADMRR